jgi:hypothetical protein
MARSIATASSASHTLCFEEFYLEFNAALLVHPSELVTILDLATFPSLEKFGYESGSRSSFPNSAIPFIGNHFHCQITHFDFSGDLQNGTTGDPISILSDLPMITHFKLQDKYSRRIDDALMSNKSLRRLTVTPIISSEFTRTDRLLPRLVSLEFKGYKPFSWSRGRLANLVNATTFNSGPNFRVTPAEKPECTNSIRHIFFSVYMVEEMERINMQSLAHFQGAHQAGIFHCQVLRGDFKGQVIDPFSLGTTTTIRKFLYCYDICTLSDSKRLALRKS